MLLNAFQNIDVYFLTLSLVFCLAYFAAFQMAKPIDRPLALKICFIGSFFGLLGARLFHVFYEEPLYYTLTPLKVFSVWDGGFVYYGGLITGAAGVGLYLKWKGHSFLQWADFWAPILSGSYVMGRLACFFNGCCYGKITDSWFSLKMFDGQLRHPTQIYSVFLEAAVLLLLLILKPKFRVKRGTLFWFWLYFHGFGRIIMEHLRDDFRGRLIQGLSISTWVSLGLMLIALMGIAYRKSNDRS